LRVEEQAEKLARMKEGSSSALQNVPANVDWLSADCKAMEFFSSKNTL
jgi:hypothetical protein